MPYLYLPIAVRRQFVDALGLTYDNGSDLYLVNDTSYSKLLVESANFTFLVMLLGKLELTLSSRIKHPI
jgi:hypothetical protein